MQHIHTEITKRMIRQKNREGLVFEYPRYVLHYKDPATGKRRMERHKTFKAAQKAQNELIKNADVLRRRKGGKVPSLGEAVEYWLQAKEHTVNPHTFHAYAQVARDYIVGPTLVGTHDQKCQYTLTKKAPQGATLVPMLGYNQKIEDITTAEIRGWYQQLLSVTTPYNARMAKKHLSSIFRLIEEDYEIRLARMPSQVGPVYRRKPRKLLTEEQVKLVLEEAERDKKWGVYYAFLFFTGVRPSEMLGLLWEEVDLDAGRVRICRTQMPDGTLKATPKTNAGVREIPLNARLLSMVREWKAACPTLNGKLHRVFPAQGHEHGRGRSPLAESDHGLTLSNFRNRVWYPVLKRLSLPRLSIYATRHMAISYLQAQGVEVGLVAKLAGHASPQITLQYYTHAVRENDGVMDKLELAYRLQKPDSLKKTEVQT